MNGNVTMLICTHYVQPQKERKKERKKEGKKEKKKGYSIKENKKKR